MSGLGLVLAGGETLLSRPGARAALQCAQHAAAAYRRIRRPVPDEVVELLALFGEARARSEHLEATAVGLPPDVPTAVDYLADPSLSFADPVDAEEVARVLGCKTRNARDLCSRGAFASAVKVGPSWRVERAELMELAHRRKAS